MKKFITVAAFAALAALTCTCGDVIIDGDPPPPPVSVSPRAVLQRLEYSFNDRNIETLKSCLSHNFIFHVDPEEIRRRGGALPPSTSHDEFWHIARNMFQRAYSVAMSIDSGKVGTPGPEQTEYKAENTPIKLLVMLSENGGFLAEGEAGFEFEKYQNHAGEDRWRIVKWWDGTLPEEGAVDPARPAAGVERASVAAILAYFS
jgi:hypothetical protein